MPIRFVRLCLSMLIVSGLSLPPAAGAALPLAVEDGTRLPSLAPMLERVNPAVVNIATYATVQLRNPLLDDPIFRRFFGVPRNAPTTRRTQSAGSGVVVDAAAGYIVTNNHVIDGADEISVGLADGRTLSATLIGRDAQVDLAVVKVDPASLREIAFADSSQLRVGDFVVAIGNPFGLNQTVTSGIVSALGRSGLGIEGYEDFIQTDAPINPGNSGGALVDLAGRLVGINTAIFAPSGGNVGIGFVIPANMVKAVLNQLVNHGEVQRGYIGLNVQSLTPELAEAFGASGTEGAVVVQVDPDSPAAEAGLQPGDVVIEMAGRRIEKLGDYRSQEAIVFAGDKLVLAFTRGGKPLRRTLKLDSFDVEQIAGVRLNARLRGVQLQNFRNPDDPDKSVGVLVGEVVERTPAAMAGIRKGDIIVAVNQSGVHDIEEMREAVRNSESALRLRIYRDGRFGLLTIR
ncbi:MAG: Do family serine endopeptidase [Pseudomonadales bacterium]